MKINRKAKMVLPLTLSVMLLSGCVSEVEGKAATAKIADQKIDVSIAEALGRDALALSAVNGSPGIVIDDDLAEVSKEVDSVSYMDRTGLRTEVTEAEVNVGENTIILYFENGGVRGEIA